MNALTTFAADLPQLAQDTVDFARSDKAENTLSAYQGYWKSFLKFCAANGLEAVPADICTVAMYLTFLAKGGKTASTVTGHLSAIKYFMQRNGSSLDTASPILISVLDGIRRTIGTAQKGSDAVLPDDLRRMVTTCDKSPIGVRNKALILLGFAGAFRRSEITSLTQDNLSFVEEGVVVSVRRSKTDQYGEGQEVAIPFAKDHNICPVLALQAWLKLIGGGEALFPRVFKGGMIGTEAMSDEAVRLIVIKAAQAAGLDGKITPHSLRAGFCTAAAMAEARIDRIAKHARHSNIQTTMRYIRVAERFKDHAGDGLL